MAAVQFPAQENRVNRRRQKSQNDRGAAVPAPLAKQSHAEKVVLPLPPAQKSGDPAIRAVPREPVSSDHAVVTHPRVVKAIDHRRVPRGAVNRTLAAVLLRVVARANLREAIPALPVRRVQKDRVNNFLNFGVRNEIHV